MQDAEAFALKLKSLIKRAGGNKLVAARAEIPLSTLNSYLSGTEMKLSVAEALARALGVSLDALASDEPATVQEPGSTSDVVMIPLRDITASAGPGTEVLDEEPRAWLQFSPLFVEAWRRNPAQVEAITARGDSMEPTIQDGAIVLIDRSERQVRPGKVYAFRTADGLRLKRYQPAIAGGILLVSDNETYKPELVSLDEFEQLKIAGRAFWTGREI